VIEDFTTVEDDEPQVPELQLAPKMREALLKQALSHPWGQLPPCRRSRPLHEVEMAGAGIVITGPKAVPQYLIQRIEPVLIRVIGKVSGALRDGDLNLICRKSSCALGTERFKSWKAAGWSRQQTTVSAVEFAEARVDA
jgi:hypothetical protein